MKNSRFGKLIAVAVSLALIVCAGALVMALADGATESKRVESAEFGISSLNVAYAEQTELVFAVRKTADAPEGDLYLLFLKAEPKSEAIGEDLFRNAAARKTAVACLTPAEYFEGREAENASQIAADEEAGAEYYIFRSEGIRASEIGVTQYVSPVIVGTEDNNANESKTLYTVGYSSLENTEYIYNARGVSVANYAVQMLVENMNNMDAAHKDLYLSILTFGYGAAQKKWGDRADEYFKITLDKNYCMIMDGAIGKDGDGFNNYILENENGNVLLRAESVKANGQYFLYWADIYGDIISYNRIISEAPVDNGSGFTTYIAVYGDKSQSAYMNSAFLEGVDAGVVTDSTKSSKTIGNFVIQGAVSGSNYITSTIVDRDGDKSLVAQRTGSVGHGNGHTLTNSAGNGMNVAELDFKLDELKSEGQTGRIVLTGEYYNFGFLTRVTNNNDGTYTFITGYFVTADAGGSGDNREQSNCKYKFGANETLVLKAKIDTSGDAPVAYVYANDELIMTAVGTLEPDTALKSKYGGFQTISADYYAGCDATITKLRIFTNMGNDNRYEYDNIVIRNEFENEFN